MDVFIGIDNGVTGSIGIICVSKNSTTTAFLSTPVKKCLSYTKEPQHIQRIDWKEFFGGLTSYLGMNVRVFVERPMVNPRAFKATQSALRALEATIIAIEWAEYPYEYIDSKQWQREFFSPSIIGHDDLKKASREIGISLFPNNRFFIEKHGDADGLLIAEYCRRHR